MSAVRSYETLLAELADGVLTVTLNRPDRLNAYNAAMQTDLLTLFDAVNQDDAVRVVVVTGAGRGFCAGMDISGGTGAFRAWGAQRKDNESIAIAIYDSKKPVIAAINGVAVGVGITMCLPMDVRLMSSTARIGFIFNRRGMVMEAGSAWFLPRLVGMQRAQEWVASGEIFGPEEALAGGLVRSVHAPEELLPAAQALARKFADGTSAVSTALNRQMMWKMAGAQNPQDAVAIDVPCIKYMGASAEGQEGIAAFVEKRPPRFPLRASADMPPFYPWWENKPAE
jgi:enoyl-CoA hydratase/carnithine racemase